VVFAGTSYRFANLDYPLLLPSLEAIDFRAMGAFDTRLLHVQFLLFLVAAILALVALLRDVVPPLILWTSVLALALAPAVFDQLLTAYADLPLALVFGVGVAAIGRWMKTDERWSLAVATLCFAGVLLLKNEGSLVVFGVFLGLFVVARHRRRAVLAAAAVDVALLVPWRIYVAIQHIHDINYSFLNSFDYGHIHGRAGVGPIAFRTLGNQMVDPGQWGLLVPIAAAVVAVALLTGPRSLSLFAVIWTLVSWVGLSWIYVISHYEYSYYLDSTKERVVASIVVGLAALTPLIAAEAWTGARGLRRVRAGGD
jgi:4-amino-4-deoxy-L-arabinose transferase-like glycosyltransferase